MRDDIPSLLSFGNPRLIPSPTSLGNYETAKLCRDMLNLPSILRRYGCSFDVRNDR